MRVDVDEARCHRESSGVDLLAAAAVYATDGGDATVLHRNVGVAGAASRAIDHGSVAHDQVV